MNYIHQANGFWDVQDEHNLTVTDIALYFYLLKISNRPGEWINPFKRINSKIVADLGISKPTLSNSRNRLKQVGLIDFKTVSGDANVQYLIIDLQKIFAGNYAGNNIGAMLGSTTSPIGGEDIHNIDIKESKGKKEIIEYEVAFFFFRQTSNFRILGDKHNVDIEEKFKIFYEEKKDLGDFKNKTQEDLVKHFSNWLPIHLRIEKKEKSSAKKESGAGGRVDSAFSDHDEYMKKFRQ